MSAGAVRMPAPPPSGLADQVLDAARDGVVICDADLRYVWANPAACALLGYALPDLVGRDFRFTFPERMRPVMTEAYREQLAGRTGTFSGTLLRSDGTEMDISWSNLSFESDGRRFGAAIFHPVGLPGPVSRAVTAPDPLVLGTHPAALLEDLDRLAAAGRSGTRALMVALDLVDDAFVLQNGGRAGAPAGYDEAVRFTSSQGGRIPFFDVWLSGRPVVVGEARTRLRVDPLFVPLCDALDAEFDWNTAVYLALAVQGHAVGGLAAYFPTEVASPSDGEIALLAALADTASLSVEQVHLRAVAERNAALEERARLARELHDSVSQTVFSLRLHLTSAERSAGKLAVDAPADRLRSDLGTARELSTAALAEMRALLFELRPEALQEAGLVLALTRQGEAVAARTGLGIEVHGPAERIPLAERVEEQLYRIALEAVNNAVKHAGGTAIRVDVRAEDPGVVVEVRDDGSGIDWERMPAGHLGLATMRDRAEGVGGSLTITTGPAGTRVRVAVPPETGGRS